jgi:putative redox protein
MVTINAIYEGTLRARAIHGPSGVEIVTDAPIDNQGRGESFSPTDLLATALGTCMLTYIGITSQAHGWDLVGTTVRVEKHMVADPYRRVGKLVVDVVVPRPLSEKERTLLMAAMMGCPVKRSLHEDLEIVLNLSEKQAS